jgi:RNA polymerase sigma-70 factor (ECF subfamily)
MASESDRVLIQQIRGGGAASSTAWEELVARYEGRLRAYVRRRLRDHAATDDVVQETFIGFLNSLPSFDDTRELQTWLFTIASYKVTDHLRKMGRRIFKSGSDSDAEQMDSTRDVKQRAASSIARSRERLELEAEAIRRGLTELVRGFQHKGDYPRIQVLELLFVKGWPNWQVAEYLKLTEQQIANYRFNAVKRLTEGMRAAGLPTDVFPELNVDHGEK